MSSLALQQAMRSPSQVHNRATETILSTQKLFFWFAFHAALGLVAKFASPVATLWAFGTLFYALKVALTGRDSNRLLEVICYIAGAELMWRGTNVAVFWETGKFAMVGLLVLDVLRSKMALRRFEWRSAVIVLAMFPSFFVLPYFDRSDISANISGVIAIGLCTFSVHGRKIPLRTLLRSSAACMGPIISLMVISTFSTISADPRQFTPGSKVTSGGIGPNQVSSMLGLGILLAFFLVAYGPKKMAWRLLLAATATWLIGQTMLSLSRGGYWAALGAVIVAAWYLIRTARIRRIIVGTAIPLALTFNFVVFPLIDSFALGKVSSRLSDFDMTGRDLIMKADWLIFLANPVFGVGPGQSYDLHAITFRPSRAHTEYTRLLAEHGSFGVLTILLMFQISIERWLRREPPESKAIAASLTVWSLLFMFHSAIRLGAPALMFGLGGAFISVNTNRLPFPIGAGAGRPGSAPMASGISSF